MRALILLCLVAGLLLPDMAAAQADLPAALDQIASSELSRQKIPGVAAVVVKNDQVVWTTGLGVASLESKTPGHPRYAVPAGIGPRVPGGSGLRIVRARPFTAGYARGRLSVRPG